MGATTSWGKKKPLALPALSATMVAWGATPAVPTPLLGAAASLAVWVPCPFRSWTAALFEQSPLATSAGSALGLAEVMNEHDRPTSRLGAMAGGVGASDPGVPPSDSGPGPPVHRIGLTRGGVDQAIVPLTCRQRLGPDIHRH